MLFSKHLTASGIKLVTYLCGLSKFLWKNISSQSPLLLKAIIAQNLYIFIKKGPF